MESGTACAAIGAGQLVAGDPKVEVLCEASWADDHPMGDLVGAPWPFAELGHSFYPGRVHRPKPGAPQNEIHHPGKPGQSFRFDVGDPGSWYRSGCILLA